LAAAAFVSRRAIRRRYLTLRVIEEVSSSRCGDYFVRLATIMFRERHQVEDAMRRLTAVVEIRRYSNRRFLEDLRTLGIGDPAPRGRHELMQSATSR